MKKQNNFDQSNKQTPRGQKPTTHKSGKNKKQSRFLAWHKNLWSADTREFFAHKLFYIIVFASLGFVFLASLVFMIVDTATGAISGNPTTNQGGFPSRLLSPFVDMTSWVPVTNNYSVNGVADIAKVSNETNINYFHLGFIQPDQTTPLDADGNIRWCWGGYPSISENGADAYQYAGIVYAIDAIRERGGDVCISFGGQFGKAPWAVSKSAEKLKNMYVDVIKTYNCKRIDLDIEESNQGEAENRINAQAVAAAQAETGVAVSLTIPIMPYGWENKQIKLIRAYLDAGVDIALINSMTMCYGAGLNAGEDYGDASVRAITTSIGQMQKIYSDYNINLTPTQAYAKTGATMAIGYESSLYPTFTTAMAKKVTDDAIKNNYGMLSFWSINRDAKMESNRAISQVYQYYNVLKAYA